MQLTSSEHLFPPKVDLNEGSKCSQLQNACCISHKFLPSRYEIGITENFTEWGHKTAVSAFGTILNCNIESIPNPEEQLVTNWRLIDIEN